MTDTDISRPYYDLNDFGPRARAFVEALEALCVQHRVRISTTMYDGLHLRDWNPGNEVIYSNGLADELPDAKESL